MGGKDEQSISVTYFDKPNTHIYIYIYKYVRIHMCVCGGEGVFSVAILDTFLIK